MVGILYCLDGFAAVVFQDLAATNSLIVEVLIASLCLAHQLKRADHFESFGPDLGCVLQ